MKEGIEKGVELMKDFNAKGKEKTEQLITWLYEQVINGFAGFESAYGIAAKVDTSKTQLQQIEDFVRWELTKSATSGFLGGLGGLATSVVTLPVNLISLMLIQLRASAVVALLTGHDLKQPNVSALVMLSTLGNDYLKSAAQVGLSSEQLLDIAQISNQKADEIKANVIWNIYKKFSGKTAFSFGKIAPLIGGIVSGSLDVWSTMQVVKTAKIIFLPKESKSLLIPNQDLQIIKFQVIIAFLKADGELNQEEQNQLTMLLDFAVLEEKQKKMLLEEALEKNQKEIDYQLLISHQEALRWLIQTLANLAKEEEAHQGKRAFIEDLAKRTGFDLNSLS